MSSSMNRVSKALELYRKSYEAANDAARILGAGPASYYFECIKEYVEALFGKYAPFHENDRVELIRAPDIDKSSHWWGSRHFLIAGSMGTINSVDYRKGRFIANVVFDDESWVSMEGVINPRNPANRHTYCIEESILRRVPGEAPK